MDTTLPHERHGCGRQQRVCADVCRLHRQIQGSFSMVPGPTVHSRHEHSSPFRKQLEYSKSCPTSKRMNSISVCSKWASRRLVALCHEMLLYLRNVHQKKADGKTAYPKTSGVKFDGLLIPVRSKRQLQTHLHNGRVAAASIRSKRQSWNLHGFRRTCGRIVVR